jgi:hypothetical protein
MREFLKALPHLCGRAWESLSAVACVFYRAGQQALLERARARTDLAVLVVKQKRIESQFQHANNVIDLAEKLEKIKDPELRKKCAGILQQKRLGVELSTEQKTKMTKMKAQGTYDFVDPSCTPQPLMLTQRRPARRSLIRGDYFCT